MEFEEMKKVWSVQNNKPLYVINEDALRKSIVKKKDNALLRANLSELISIIANIAVGVFLCFTGPVVLAVWMIFVGLLCIVGRVRRKNGEKQFDRTMLGDLDHAVSVANYQVRFSGLMRWNIIPVGILIIWGAWEKGNLVVAIVLIVVFSSLSFFGSALEHNYYKARRNEVVQLRKTLMEVENDGNV